jgi:hypothetical protein
MIELRCRWTPRRLNANSGLGRMLVCRPAGNRGGA